MATAITGVEEEPFEHFDIAFLGFNSKLTRVGFREFIENNREQVLRAEKGALTATLRDGTRIKGLCRVDYKGLIGYRFDQLILSDDERWEIEWVRLHDICKIMEYTMDCSNVPKEFQILRYEDVRR